MKYVIFEDGSFVHPVLFADHTTHLQVSLKGAVPVAAGFVWFKYGQPHCYGASESLGLASRGDIDARIISRWYNYAGAGMFIKGLEDPFGDRKEGGAK